MSRIYVRVVKMLTETSAQKVITIGVTGTVLGYSLPEFAAMIASILTAVYMLIQCIVAIPKLIEVIKKWRSKRDSQQPAPPL